ncbi:MOSC domain-containing protein [Cesiribacter andamanensis]|uniref:MOSC domain-containing protein n=1 Tax=Cesiribacter andamanensis AMV16 TaxID=1279009 RepID=M7NQR5_9BACT|nr:MOSC N-terminal beta barrel domain-containing protein [Cesiribacter andamanensis]EMR00834.1 hypothetical protein ADICEAN_04051 [Cesiribacter andamanensis AMV16]
MTPVPSLPTISQLWIYPIKSLGGISLSEAQLSPRGLQWDRRWMLLDAQGNFMTQRQIAAMALLQVELGDNALRVRHSQKNMEPLSIPLQQQEGAGEVQAPIWDDTTLAWYVGREYDAWFSEALERPCRLVYMPEESERTATGKWSGQQQKVSFVDEYPLLLIGQASLDDLNARLQAPVPMNRFRPSMVVNGSTPFAEDTWHEIRVGELRFWGEKPCARCLVTTIDQQTGKAGKEPLQTLSRYRRLGSKVLFGQNLLCDSAGTLRVGDKLEVISYKPDPLKG